MTCIVGIVYPGGVVIGGDSAGSNGSEISIRADAKVFRNGEFLFGGTSSFRMIQLLRFSLKPPKIGKGDLYAYMCTDFIEAVRACFLDGGFMQKARDGEDQGGQFLVAVRGRLFQVDSDFQVGEPVDGVAALGCGCEYALGAVYATKKHGPERRALIALKAAERYSPDVVRPFLIDKV